MISASNRHGEKDSPAGTLNARPCLENFWASRLTSTLEESTTSPPITTTKSLNLKRPTGHRYQDTGSILRSSAFLNLIFPFSNCFLREKWPSRKGTSSPLE